MGVANPLDEYMGPLLAGNRTACRNLVLRKLESAPDPALVYEELLWPAMEHLEKLYRGDRINTATEHMATRINRSIADQVQMNLHRSPSNNKRIVITCADAEPEELGSPTPTVTGRRGSVAEVFGVALRLGLTSFGGPIAHLGYFRAEYVEREARITDLPTVTERARRLRAGLLTGR